MEFPVNIGGLLFGSLDSRERAPLTQLTASSDTWL
jgi:hypothetical protein